MVAVTGILATKSSFLMPSSPDALPFFKPFISFGTPSIVTVTVVSLRLRSLRHSVSDLEKTP